MFFLQKDLSEPKYEFLTKKRENAGIKHLNDSEAFIECSNNMNMFMRILMNAPQQENQEF